MLINNSTLKKVKTAAASILTKRGVYLTGHSCDLGEAIARAFGYRSKAGLDGAIKACKEGVRVTWSESVATEYLSQKGMPLTCDFVEQSFWQVAQETAKQRMMAALLTEKVDANGFLSNTSTYAPDPFTFSNNDIVEFMTAEAWVQQCAPGEDGQKITRPVGSYGAKHRAESMKGPLRGNGYVSNGMLILAAMINGYKVLPDRPDSINGTINFGWIPCRQNPQILERCWGRRQYMLGQTEARHDLLRIWNVWHEARRLNLNRKKSSLFVREHAHAWAKVTIKDHSAIIHCGDLMFKLQDKAIGDAITLDDLSKATLGATRHAILEKMRKRGGITFEEIDKKHPLYRVGDYF